MNIKFDPQVDAAYIRLNNSKIVESEEVSPGIVYDFDEDDCVVSIEVLNVKHRTPNQFKELIARSDSPFSSEFMNQFTEFFRLQSHSL